MLTTRQRNHRGHRSLTTTNNEGLSLWVNMDLDCWRRQPLALRSKLWRECYDSGLAGSAAYLMCASDPIIGSRLSPGKMWL